MSFKGPNYRCWSCGAGGDAIDFVSRMFGLSALEAAKKLNYDLGLGIDIGKPVSQQRVAQIHRDNELYKAFEEWEKSAFITLVSRIHQLEGYKRDFPPRSPDNFPKPYVEACLYLDYTIYLWDCLFYADFDDKVTFYIMFKGEVEAIARKVGQAGNTQKSA